MIRKRLFALFIALVMLMPLLTSCSPVLKKSTVVKADDPWYESVKFKLQQDTRAKDVEGGSCICASDDKLFLLYNFTPDRWGSSVTALDIYDLNGNLIKRQDISCPDGCNVLSINSITVTPDGKTITAAVGYLGENRDGPVFTSIDTGTFKMTNLKKAYSKKVNRIRKKDTSVHNVYLLGDYAVVILLNGYPAGGVLDWQWLLYKNNEFVAELDLSSLSLGEILPGFSVDEKSDSLFASAYDEDTNIISMEFDIKTGKLKDTKALNEQDDNKVNYAEYRATDNGDMCKIDSYGNIMKIDKDDMAPKTMIDTNWYTPYFSSNADQEHISKPEIISCNEERTIIFEANSTIYSSEYSVSHSFIRVLKKADKNPHAGKKVINLALPPNSGVSDYLAKAVYEFNQTDKEYIIRLWDKYKSGFNTMLLGVGNTNTSADEKQINTMIQDLKGGDAPDLIIGIQKKYAMNDDVFMDLTNFLDPAVMEKQYKNIFDAAKVDGKQYFFPVTLEIEGLVTNTELLKEGAVGITFEDYDRLVKEKMNGFSPYDYPYSTAYNKRSFILSCIDTKSAIEGKNIDFGTEQFRAAVTYAKDNFKYDDEKSTPREYVFDFNRYRGECYYAKIDDYLDYVHACFKEKGQYDIIGTPSVNASGPRLKALETISVSAFTGEKDGCRCFLNYLFSGSAYSSENPEFRLIVTNKEIMERDIDAVTKYNNAGVKKFNAEVESGASIPAVGLDKATGDKMATDAMKERFLKSLSELSTYYYEDQEITKFVFEEIAPYLAGDHSLDEAIAVLNDRATKYIREL